MQKARGHHLKGGSHRSQAHGFRFSFTPLPGVLPTFPSRYWFTIGLRQSLALRDGPRGFGQDSSCPALLRCRSRTIPVACTGVSPSAPRLSGRFQFRCFDFNENSYNPGMSVNAPV